MSILTTERWQAWALALSLAVCYVYVIDSYPSWVEPNSGSRVYLTLAIIDDGSLSIDRCLQRYGDIQDKAHVGGHFYSDKAPGYSFLLVPIAWVLRKTAIAGDDYAGMLYGLRLLGLSLPAVAFWMGIRGRLAAFAGSVQLGLALIVVGALGTNFFIYSTHLFAHVPAGILCFLAFNWTHDAGRTTSSSLRLAKAAGAGLLAGTAFTVDYVVVVAVAVLALYALVGERFDAFRFLAFVAGLLPPLCLWMAYNYACFDHPLRVGFHFHADEQYAEPYRQGFWGVQTPHWRAFAGMSGSPSRGLFFFSPVLLLAPWGWLVLSRDREHRRLAVVSLLVVLAIAGFAATTVDWKGGWSMGTRYLVPAIPFLLVGVCGALRNLRPGGAKAIVFSSLTAVGLLLAALAEVTFPFFPDEFRNPAYNLAWPLLRERTIANNLLSNQFAIWSLVPVAMALAVALGLVLEASFRGTWRAQGPRMILAAVLVCGVLAVQSTIGEPSNRVVRQAVSLGHVFYFRGESDRAIEQYRRAVEFDPFAVYAHQLLVTLYRQKGDLDAARHHLNELRSIRYLDSLAR